MIVDPWGSHGVEVPAVAGLQQPHATILSLGKTQSRASAGERHVHGEQDAVSEPNDDVPEEVEK